MGSTAFIDIYYHQENYVLELYAIFEALQNAQSDIDFHIVMLAWAAFLEKHVTARAI